MSAAVIEQIRAAMMKEAAAAAAAAGIPPTAKPPAQKSEDEDQDGTSIDTFQEYQPSALPDSIIHLCNTFGNNNDSNLPISTSSLEMAKETTTASVTEDSDTSSTESPPSAPKIKLTIPSHTSSACESALLSSVHAPKLPEESAECLFPLLTENNNNNDCLALSPLQLEGALLAIQRHRRVYHSRRENQFLPQTTTRAGFFLGDGAGIGKGRQISAMIRDSCCRGRTRHVWLSVSRELVQDAKRDLRDVGVHVPVHDGTNFLGDRNSPGLGRTEKGCLFLTYNLLVSTSRLEQIIAWLAGTEHIKNIVQRTAAERSFGGLIVFDEAHKAKNLLQNTKTAQLVLQLQRRLPNARVVYASATGVSDIAQLAYAERLGLWNTTGTNAVSDGTQYADFKTFKNALEQRGLGSMELLALELKIRGSFLARTLSWEGAEFQTEDVALDLDQQRVYNNCVEWFIVLKNEIESAFQVFGDNFPGSFRSQIWRTFWAAHQRFFKELAICAKVPFIAQDALKQIESGCCVVIGLQSTGDAGMQSILGEGDTKAKSLLSEDERFETLVSTVSAGLTRFVEQNFPITAPPPVPPKLPPNVPTSGEDLKRYRMIELEIERINALPPAHPHPVLMAMRQQMLDAIPHLGLPPNPLDDLIDRLGGPDQVAEMTGRPGRVIRRGDHFVYAKRIVKEKSAAVAASDESERVNLKERREFMDGKKPVAIISDAASTGISLHAANGSGASHKRRVHYTIELPWSADKAVQQLGRSHRSGQNTAPIYKLVVTNLGGERRFAAAVSKRLASLGALTKGDRRAATGSDMSSFDLDSKYGKRALKHLYRKLHENDGSGVEEPQSSNFLPSRNADEIIDEFVKEAKETNDPFYHALPNDKRRVVQSLVLSLAVGELDKVGLDRDARAKADVRAFLNRIAGISVLRQSLVFSLFMSTLNDVIKDAKTTGEFEGTAEDITATHISIGKEVDLAIDPSSGAPTKMTTLLLDRGISFEEACGMALEAARAMEDEVEESMNGDTEKKDDAPLVAHNDDNLEGFIVEDDESEDEWFSQSKPSKPRGRAEPGFYISKKKVAGRHYILFAKGKFDYSTFKTKEEAIGFDPLGFMQISRPNTGTSGTDMSTRDLHRKYYFACGCDVLKESTLSPVEAIKQANKKVGREWEAAYSDSFSFDHKEGLAPRRVKVALVHGPVLHILPALERAVLFRSGKDKSLKIMRANVGNRPIVGVRFPHDDDANQKLHEELDKILKARQNAGTFYTDQDLEPICNKSQKWATAERKTMKSFFQVKGAPSEGGKLNNTSNKNPAASNTKRVTPPTSSSARKKTKTMMSFFSVKKPETKQSAADEIDLTGD